MATAIAAEQQYNIFLDWAWAISYWTIKPLGLLLWYLALAVLLIAKALYWPVAFLLQPLLVLGRVLLNVAALPFRLLVRFQDLYIYLGIAAIIGVIGGLLLYVTYSTLRSILHLDKMPEAPLPPMRTAKQYRQEKQQQKIKTEAPLLSPVHLVNGNTSPGYFSLSDGSRGRQRGLLAHTIMEEEDSDF